VERTRGCSICIQLWAALLFGCCCRPTAKRKKIKAAIKLISSKNIFFKKIKQSQIKLMRLLPLWPTVWSPPHHTSRPVPRVSLASFPCCRSSAHHKTQRIARRPTPTPRLPLWAVARSTSRPLSLPLPVAAREIAAPGGP